MIGEIASSDVTCRDKVPLASDLQAGAGLQRLIEDLDQACVGHTHALGASVTAALRRACRSSRLLESSRYSSGAAGYTRHLLHADAAGRYTLVALVWEPGQFSPVHAHDTWCGYAVIDGCLSESSYALVCGDPLARRLETIDRAAGCLQFSYAGLDEIHRLGNDGEGTAISIHAYGIDASRIATHVNRLVPVAPH